MESINNTPLLLLRNKNKSFKARQKQLDKRVRNKKLLREEIYSNHNIFQSNIDLYRNMTAQNIIWDKNYSFKCLINQIKDENSSLKARIWNMEKENRRMQRQIEAWNLTHYVQTNSSKKPYIDMMTVQTVVGDQDYQIVSMKMQIFQLQKKFQEKQAEYTALLQQTKEVTKLARVLNHDIATKKVQLYQCLDDQGENSLKKGFGKESKQKLSRMLMKQNKQLQLHAKNVEIKKKSQINIQNQLEVLRVSCEQEKEISRLEIERLGEETLKMRTEQDGGIGLEKEKLRFARKATKDYQCFMQGQMDRYIEMKIPLQLEIDQLRQKLAVEDQVGKTE